MDLSRKPRWLRDHPVEHPLRMIPVKLQENRTWSLHSRKPHGFYSSSLYSHENQSHPRSLWICMVLSGYHFHIFSLPPRNQGLLAGKMIVHVHFMQEYESKLGIPKIGCLFNSKQWQNSAVPWASNVDPLFWAFKCDMNRNGGFTSKTYAYLITILPKGI